MSDCQKWKRKRKQRETAARIRDIKQAKLEAAACSSSGSTTSAPSRPSTSGVSRPSTSAASEPDEDESRPIPCIDSENERPDYSSSEEEFDPQAVFDDWVSSLCLHDRKMLAVMLFMTLQKRLKFTKLSSALESAWITGFNEKTIRGYGKDFLENSGKFEEERRGKYKRLSLFNDENLRMDACFHVDQGTCCPEG